MNELDEKAMKAAREAFAGDHGDDPEVYLVNAIRAYLSSLPAGDYAGLVERLHEVGGFIQKEHGRVAAASSVAIEAASTLQTFSARNKELEAENEMLRKTLAWHEMQNPHFAEARRAALSAPNGGQDD